MKRKMMLKLLTYEVAELRIWHKVEETLQVIIMGDANVDAPCGDYEMMWLVLDKLGVPPDEKIPRDHYNDLYYSLYTDFTIPDDEVALVFLDSVIEKLS
jgi:hypothetical protein